MKSDKKRIPRYSARLIFVTVLTAAAISIFALPTNAKQPLTTNESPLGVEAGVEALASFVAEHPDKLALVLVSTPGCGFCDRLRKEQLATLPEDPVFSNVSIFEVMMRDRTPFEPAIQHLTEYGGQVFKDIKSPNELSLALKLRVAPTVLFLGNRRELSERLVGYGNPDFYSAYLSERIDTATDRLTKP